MRQIRSGRPERPIIFRPASPGCPPDHFFSPEASVRRLFTPLALILLGGLAVAGVVGADAGTQVGRVVAGILGYARWPAPPETFRFCLAGEVRHLHDARDSLGQMTRQPLSVRNLADHEAAKVADCDVLYLGGLAPAQRSRLLAEAVGKPVLTISEGDSVCAEPSMFCLAVQGGEVGLLVNLDAISRSGIRINPKVLQLVRRKQGVE